MGGATRLFTLITSTTTYSSPLLLPHHRYCPALLRLSRHHGDSQISIPSLSHRLYCFHNQHPEHQSSSPSSPPSSFHLVKASRQIHVRATESSNQPSSVFHQWPEWSSFIHNISAAGYFNRQGIGAEIEEFVDATNLPDDFVRPAVACLSFGSDRPEILGLLSRRDIATVISNGRPSLFKNAEELVKRMQLFLDEQHNNVPSTETLQTIDLMKFLVSYAGNIMMFEDNNLQKKDAVELSVRNIFSQLSNFSYKSPPNYEPSSGVQNQFGDSFVQGPKPVGASIEMKRGDWICPRCDFMNFARNNKCLECEEARPKKQLTGGEWECPRCDFFNYERNIACLRCDCKRPGEVSLGTMGSGPGLGSGYGSHTSNRDTESRLAANEEKAQRWFSKISRSENSSDINIAENDFPEIMPLRNGVNRFVVSTRKTHLERRLADAQNRRTFDSESSYQGQTTDLFAESTENPGTEMNENCRHGGQEQFLENQNLSCKEENEEAAKSDRWFKRVAELHNCTDDVDFPEMMPMRKGENRFVIAKKKDRSLTTPTYKRRMAMEQANDTSYVPFVPFPANYFANKDDQQPGGRADLTNKVMETPNSSTHESSAVPGVSNSASVRGMSNQQYPTGQRDSGDRMFEMNKNSAFDAPTHRMHTRNTRNDTRIGGAPSTQRNSAQPTPNLNSNPAGSTTTESYGRSGKSLEGSAVKEPDPLDMSEEAKAERWFKRVAQIKDISELSQIPDEDFPSIMPMRKGVNRFVVSKRKTPLQRRLTSTQYRRNLPIVSSDQPPTNTSDDSQ